jgi:hypothetical protein
MAGSGRRRKIYVQGEIGDIDCYLGVSLLRRGGLFAASPPLKYRQADFRVRAFRCYPSRKKKE